MKKSTMLVMLSVLLTACEKPVSNEPQETETVTLTFSPYEMSTMRTVQDISEVVTRLDVWLYESGTEVQAVHQSAADDGFGSVSVTLDKTKTYTLYAIGHKAASACTLSEGVIAFPDDAVKEAMFYTTTFSPFTTSSLSCLMMRIVGQFRMETTDVIPSDVDHVKLTISSTATRYNVNGTLEKVIDREVNYVSVSSRNDGTVALTTNILSTSAASSEFDISVVFYDADDNIIQNRTFSSVPIRAGYRTTYRGAFFTDAAFSESFTVDEWSAYDVVNY